MECTYICVHACASKEEPATTTKTQQEQTKEKKRNKLKQ